MQIRGEMARRVEALDVPKTVGFCVMHLRAEIELPENVEGAPLVVVVETNKFHESRVALRGRRHDRFDQPLAMADLDDVSLARRVPRNRVCREDGLRGCALNSSVGLEQTGCQ